MSKSTTNRGFTIVELLIVIVVIAILAAISIVAYSGIQNRAKTSSGQQLAAQVEKKAQAYYTILNTYPVDKAGFANTEAQEAALEGDVAFVTTAFTPALTPTEGANGEAIGYVACNDGAATTTQADVTGVKISYYDYAESSVETRVLGDCEA